MARVVGTELYRVEIAIDALAPRRWKQLVRDCAGGIGSLVELLKGRFSSAVMEVLVRPEAGLFPSPREIAMECSCPDRALLCKHLAATLYGVAARLDARPELFFTLRRVDPLDLLASAADTTHLAGAAPASEKRLDAAEDLAALFGIDLAPGESAPSPVDEPAARPRARKAAAPKTREPKKRSPGRKKKSPA
jgi:uncharacterized Zn finger protein